MAGTDSLGIPGRVELSPYDTQRSSHSAAEPDLRTPLAANLSDARLLELFGISPNVAFQTSLSLRPPSLPSKHISRRHLFPELALSLARHSTLAVVAYPNSGKTIVVAEFASLHPSASLWFTLPTHPTASESWYVLLCWKLSQFLQVDSFSPQDIADAIIQRVATTPILLVIDNAQQCNDLKELSLIQQVAEASNQRLQIVMIATDEPPFRTKASAAGIAIWPCPGMNIDEATQLYECDETPLSDMQKAALDFLLSKIDGHIGLLRLEHRRVRTIRTTEDCASYIRALRDGLGSDAENKRAHIIEQFRTGLPEDSFTLCKMVSLAIEPFAERIANAVWSSEKDAATFSATWNGCVVSAFDVIDANRYSLPDLYQQGCRKFCTPDEHKKWNLLIADELERPTGEGIDIGDVSTSIAHRVLGGAQSEALRKAAMFLIMARGPDRKMIRRHLAARFMLWLSSAAGSKDTAPDARALWHSIWFQVCEELGWKTAAKESLSSLEQVLTNNAESIDRLTRSTGWGVLLTNAAITGNVELTIQASKYLESEDTPKGFPRCREFSLFSALMTSKRNPLPHLQEMVNQLATTSGSSKPLWDKQLNYQFWRHLGMAIYFASLRYSRQSSTSDNVELADVEKTVDALHAAGEHHVATVIGASLVRILIDIERDFSRALAFAMHLAATGTIYDPAVNGHLKMTIADTLRCTGDLLPAEQQYREALTLWPRSQELDRSENLSMLAITVARQGRYTEASRLMQQATANYLRISDRASAVRCHLEAACMWARSGRRTHAVRELIAAHSLVEIRDATCPEWVLLAQIALGITAGDIDRDAASSIPVPGFTLAIDGPVAGAENMIAHAPTAMLARACSEVGLPNRAAYYYRIAFGNSELGIDAPFAAMAFRNALDLGDLTNAPFLAAIATRVSEHPETKAAELQTPASFNYDFLVGPAVYAFVNRPKEEPSQIESALSLLASPQVPHNEPVQVLRASLEAILQTERGDNLVALEDAYQTASHARAPIVKYHLAWYCVFRALWGRQLTEDIVVQWLLRYCLLAVRVGKTDLPFLTSAATNLVALLESAAKSSALSVCSQAYRLASNSPLNAHERLQAQATLFANWRAKHIELAVFLDDLNDAVTSGSFNEIGEAVDILITRLLGIILLPLANKRGDELRNYVAKLSATIDSGSTGDNPSLRRWTVATQRLHALTETLKSGQPSQVVSKALLDWLDEEPQKLQTTSAANYYVWLYHMSPVRSLTPEARLKMWGSVGGSQAAALAVDMSVTCPQF